MNCRAIRVLAAAFLCFCTTKGMVQEIRGTSIDLTKTVWSFGLRPVHGTVRDPQGRLLKDVEVRSQDSEARNSPPFHTFALTDQSGAFTTHGARVLFLEKKGYTPAAMKLADITPADKDEALSVILVPESKKTIPKCTGPNDQPSIRLNPLRYSLPPGVAWEKTEGDWPDFTICTVWEEECLLIYRVQDPKRSSKPDVPSTDLKAGYGMTQVFEAHPEFADLGDLQYAEAFKSKSGRGWTNWNGTGAGKPWRWFKGPDQVAWYRDVSNKSAKVFDAIINSACREKEPAKDPQK
jgi:hypothetical protein